jgi:phospholipid-translocating ATPase
MNLRLLDLLYEANYSLGDKQQTAIEIGALPWSSLTAWISRLTHLPLGFSCNLLKRDTEIMILSADSPEAARSKIEAGLNKIASIVGPPSFDNKGRPRPTSGSAQGFAVVIDGDTLRYALEPALKPLFLNLGTQCETVVCCRVSPAQKALTVKLVR